jgi:hypothetical protein
MKNLVLSLAILLTISSAFAQNINFPDSNAIWSVYNEKYFVDGDSTFNAIDYKKYYLSNDSIITSSRFFALLREDILTKKIFAISSGNTQEHLLYDFSLSINDTVSVFPLSFPFTTGPILVKVESVDSVLIGDSFNRRLKIIGENWNSGFEEYWIEGIGSTMGIFNSGITGVVITDIWYPTLLCFEKDGILLFHNPYFTDCFENNPSGITEADLATRTNVFPNPTNSSLLIKSNKEIVFVSLITAKGEIVINKHVGEKSFTIDISDFPAGLYTLILYTDEGILVKKIIKNGL